MLSKKNLIQQPVLNCIILQHFFFSSEESDEEYNWEDDDAGYFDDGGGGDIMGSDKEILSRSPARTTRTTTVRPLHRRHLHNHPYDRGPKLKNPSAS